MCFGRKHKVVDLTMKMVEMRRMDTIFVIYGVDLGGNDHGVEGSLEVEI